MKCTLQLIACMFCAAFAAAEACADASPLDKFIDYRANGTNGVFILNTNCWAYGIDTSCVSMWNSGAKNEKAGTAISKRHVLAAAHHFLGIGWELYFCGTDENIYTNRVAGSRVVSGTDIQIVSLQNELPDAVTPAYLLPTNFHEYIWTGKYLPVLRFDQDERCIVNEIADGLPFVGTPYVDEARFVASYPQIESRRPFFAYTRSGDSGNPTFLILGDLPILLGAAHKGINTISNGVYQGCGSPFVTYYANEIQVKMNELVPGYSLHFVDLSQYPKIREGIR